MNKGKNLSCEAITHGVRRLKVLPYPDQFHFESWLMSLQRDCNNFFFSKHLAALFLQKKTSVGAKLRVNCLPQSVRVGRKWKKKR